MLNILALHILALHASANPQQDWNMTKDEFVAGVNGIGKIFYTLVRV